MLASPPGFRPSRCITLPLPNPMPGAPTPVPADCLGGRKGLPLPGGGAGGTCSCGTVLGSCEVKAALGGLLKGFSPPLTTEA